MYEITINLSWLPAWMLWTAGGAVYIMIGILLSCYFKGREAVQDYFFRNGCGKECCPGNICGQRGHHCNGNNLTTDHFTSSVFYETAKGTAIPLWPVVLVMGIFWRGTRLIKDLWYHAEQYALKNMNQKG